MNLLLRRFFLLMLMLLPLIVSAQEDDDLLGMLEQEEEPTVDYTSATFKTTRLINGHSIETNSGGVMLFLISHRFGRVNDGAYEFFGLDNATIRLGLEYGITDRLDIGVGRSSFEKTYDGFVKYKLLRQKTGEEKFPFTLTLFSSVALKTLRWTDPTKANLFTSRLYYTYQALIASKITDGLSIQLAPTLVHRNLATTGEDNNDVFAIGIGGRQKITGSVTINAEYFYVLPNQIVSPLFGEPVRNSLSVGLDIETGGHVFQLHFTNSRGMIEKFFITETTGSWGLGDIHFGFNISRVFTVARKGNRGEY